MPRQKRCCRPATAPTRSFHTVQGCYPMLTSSCSLNLALLVFLSLFTAQGSCAADWPWPRWQGANYDAVSTESGLLQSIPSSGPKRLWLFDQCGLGYSGPAIVGENLFILGAKGSTEHLLRIDTQNGTEVWSTELNETYTNDWGDGPRSTPTVDGDRVYVITPVGKLYCIRRTDGELVWTQDFKDYGGTIPTWGYTESPLVLGDRVFCTPGNEQGAMAAFDKATGELIWQATELADVAHYSSIVPMQQGGKTTLVQLLFKELVGVDPADGRMLWSIPYPGNVAVIPTPIVSGNRVYCTAGYGGGCMLVEVNGEQASVVYDNKNMVNHHGGVILHEGHIFGYSDGKGWVCQDFATGEITWRERSALGKGAIAYADGRFYCLSEDEGELVMISASTEGWEEHGRWTLDPQTTQRKPRGKVWVHPVIADGKLYLRDQELLFCFDAKAE